MRKTNPVRSGLLLLVIGGVVGYAIGLGLDLLVSGSLNYNGSVAAAFALFLAVSSFFFGLYGYRGITRCPVWEVIGTLLGALFISGIRALIGSKAIFGPFLFSEPAWVFGALAGDISFLFGVGVVSDWVKWARGLDTPGHHEDEPGWGKYFNVS